jgi:hypothetical protein
MAWNDERLNELFERVDRGFARVDGEMMFRLCVAIMIGMASLIATLIGAVAAGAL